MSTYQPPKAMVFNLANIKALKPAVNRYEVQCKGFLKFILRVNPSGSKIFCLRYRLKGQRKVYTIGSFGEYSPALARQIATDKLANAVHKQDPQTAKVKNIKTIALGKFIQGEYRLSRNPKSARTDVKDLENAFKDWLTKDLSNINRGDVYKWRDQEKDRGLAPATLNRRYASLMGVFSYAVKLGYLKTNHISNIKKLDEDNSRIRFFSADEYQRFLAAIESREQAIFTEYKNNNYARRIGFVKYYRDIDHCHFADHVKPLILIAMNTGTRWGELSHMTWEDIDLQANQIKFHSSHTKTKKTYYVPMNDFVVNVLSKWREQLKDATGIVFKNVAGGPLKSVEYAYKKILKEANIVDFCWHDLRHDFATQVAKKTGDLYLVSKLLNHHSILQTQRYAHICENRKARAVALLDGDRDE